MQAFVIDAFMFCQNREQRSGSTKIADFVRLSKECANGETEIKWSLQGGVNQLGLPQLVLVVEGGVQLMCQRCLTAFRFVIDSQSELILAKNEEHADEIEAMLEDDEVDVVVGGKSFDVMDLIEDEVLLAIPQSPKHAVCPDVVLDSSDVSVAAKEGSAENASAKVSPFAVLKKLNGRT